MSSIMFELFNEFLVCVQGLMFVRVILLSCRHARSLILGQNVLLGYINTSHLNIVVLDILFLMYMYVKDHFSEHLRYISWQKDHINI